MEKKKRMTLRELVAKEQILAPCVYDCISARAAEMSGYKAMVLSGGALAYSMDGLPDMAFHTADELIWATERIATYSHLPLIVDADDGYGESPLGVYRTTSRLVKAGAMCVTIDDSTGIRGFERLFAQNKYEPKVIARKAWLSKIKAAQAACEGTDCMLIARTECEQQYGFDEAIERCVRARELGAEMTLIVGGLNNVEDAKKVAKLDIGWKMWPDIVAKNGIPNVEMDDIAPLGFNLVTMHVFEKAALYGMLLYGTENFKNQNTVFSDDHDMNGISKEEQMEALSMNYRWWLDKEKEFKKV